MIPIPKVTIEFLGDRLTEALRENQAQRSLLKLRRLRLQELRNTVKSLIKKHRELIEEFDDYHWSRVEEDEMRDLQD